MAQDHTEPSARELPLCVPTRGSEVLQAFASTTADDMHRLFPPTQRQVALAHYLAACVRYRLRREGRGDASRED